MGSKLTDAGTGRSALGLGRLLAGLRRLGWRRSGVILATLALVAGLIMVAEDLSGPGRQRSAPYAAQTLSPPLGISKPPPGSRPPAQDRATDASERQPSGDTSQPRTDSQHDASTPQRELGSAAGRRSSAPSQQDVSSAGTTNPRVDRPPAAAARVAVPGAASVQITIAPVTRAQVRPPQVKITVNGSQPATPGRPTPTQTAPLPSRGAAAVP
jgi:hypothetical protein